MKIEKVRSKNGVTFDLIGKASMQVSEGYNEKRVIKMKRKTEIVSLSLCESVIEEMSSMNEERR